MEFLSVAQAGVQGVSWPRSTPHNFLSLQLQLCHFHSALLHSRQKPWPSPAAFFRRNVRVLPPRFSSPTPLWRKVLSTAVVGAPLLLGARYVTAEAREKRRMRLVVDGGWRPCLPRQPWRPTFLVSSSLPSGPQSAGDLDPPVTSAASALPPCCHPFPSQTALEPHLSRGHHHPYCPLPHLTLEGGRE
uniref:Uncharacterized protein n=1 Tax=Macaca fascicularis TaxID=9541 RepID=A0A7N9D3A6_MACFA